MLDIIIPTHNHIEYTIQCIEAIKRYTAIPYRITCIDDSTDNLTPQYLESLKDSLNCKYVYFERTEGNANLNKGLAETESNPCVFMAQNTIVEPYWYNYPLSIFDEKTIGLIGIKLLYPSGIIEHAGIIQVGDAWADIGRGEPGHRYSYTLDVPAVGFALVFINRLAFPDGFPEKLYPYGFAGPDDVDICFTIRKQGWRVIYCGESSAFHIANAVRTKDEKYYERAEACRKFFISRWGTNGTER